MFVKLTKMVKSNFILPTIHGRSHKEGKQCRGTEKKPRAATRGYEDHCLLPIFVFPMFQVVEREGQIRGFGGSVAGIIADRNT